MSLNNGERRVHHSAPTVSMDNEDDATDSDRDTSRHGSRRESFKTPFNKLSQPHYIGNKSNKYIRQKV